MTLKPEKSVLKPEVEFTVSWSELVNSTLERKTYGFIHRSVTPAFFIYQSVVSA